jgi:hypothetical protein
MALSETDVAIAAVLAFATVVGIVVTAPSLSAGVDRLKLICNTVGLVIVVAGFVAGAAMLAWGLIGHSKELIYLSLIPFVAAGLTYGAITRRHATWYGLLGFNDSSERWRSFWNETRRLWGYGPAPQTGHPWTARRTAAPAPGAPSSGMRSFSFSFNLGGNRGGAGGSFLPLARFAAHGLASDRVSVFPSELQMAIRVAGMGPMERAQLTSYRHQLTVRRDDGGPLQLAVGTDLRFLGLDIRAQGFDGSYAVDVALLPQWLEAGSYSGAITIETGDPLQPRLIVPVTATIA